MKFEVPLRIPETASTRSPAKLSRRARRIGMPPATAASNASAEETQPDRRRHGAFGIQESW